MITFVTWVCMAVTDVNPHVLSPKTCEQGVAVPFADEVQCKKFRAKTLKYSDWKPSVCRKVEISYENYRG